MSGTISLSGTSYAFSTLDAAGLTVSGTAILGAGASISGAISLAANELTDFSGTLTAASVTLAAGAVLTGAGTVAAAMLAGPGTLAVLGGDTLLVPAASITAAALNIAGGGVLVLGADTVAAAATLGFTGGTGLPAAGGYADNFGQGGGVIVIDDGPAFGGTITGFAPGDRLVLPGLSALSVSNVTANSFEISGRDSANASVQFTLQAAIPAGTALLAGMDAQGDGEISLQAGAIEVAVGGSPYNAGIIDASAGSLQNILELQLLVPGWTSQSLTLTLSVANGVLSAGTMAAASSLVLTAASPSALNASLAALDYTAASGTAQDALTLSGGSGLLAGLAATLPITIKPAGTIAGFASGPTDAQTALFAGPLTLVSAPAAPGDIVITKAADFADDLAVNGIGGTALVIDAGGIGVFDAASVVTLGGNVTVGNAGGAGTLAILTGDFLAGGNLLAGSSSLAAGSEIEILGAASVAGTLMLGLSAASRLDLMGDLLAGGTTIDPGGTLTARGDAAGALGGLVDAGTLLLQDQAQLAAANLILTGALALNGQAALSGLSSAVIGGSGSLVVGAGALFEAGALNGLGGGVSIAGLLEVTGNLVSGGLIQLGGGTLAAAAMTLGSGGLLSGFGDVMLGAGSLLGSGGNITASGGALVLDANLTLASGASAAIAGTASMDLIEAASGQIVFGGVNSELIIGDIAGFSASVSGMVGHDVIDLAGIAPSLVSFSAGRINVENAGGQVIAGFSLAVAGGQPGVTIVSDNAAGALVTLGDELACFARGTRLLTPSGYKPIEAFRPDDPIITQAGGRQPVRWIGWREVAVAAGGQGGDGPVVVRRGALAPECPARDIRLSPSHAVFLDGVLVPVRHLVNGATIIWERRAGTVTYYHLELDRHAVVIADGLPVESYLDTGNRGQFQHETGTRKQGLQSYAALVTEGPVLAQVRRQLHEAALQAGFTAVREPMLRGMVGDLTVLPEVQAQHGGTIARFNLPQGVRRMMLIARSAAPADTDPESDDRRELGVCLRQPRSRRDRLQLGAGWYQQAAGDAGIWMGGSGELFVPHGRTAVELRLAAVAQRWRAPDGH